MNEQQLLIKAIEENNYKKERTWLNDDNTKRTTRYEIEIITQTKCKTCGDDKRVGYWSRMHDRWLDQGSCPDCCSKE